MPAATETPAAGTPATACWATSGTGPTLSVPQTLQLSNWSMASPLLSEQEQQSSGKE